MVCCWPLSKTVKSSLSRLDTNLPSLVVTVTGTRTSLTPTRMVSSARSRKATNTPAHRTKRAKACITQDYTGYWRPREALLRRRDLQFRQAIVECLFGGVDQSLVSGRVDIRIRAALLEFGVLGGHLIKPGVRAHKHVARQRAQDFEALDEVLADIGITGIVAEIGRVQADAAHHHDVVGLAAVVNLKSPGGAALGVPGREMGRQSHAAQGYGIAVMQHAIDGMGLAAGADVLERRDILGYSHHRRAGQFLHHRVAGGVIRMGMAVQQNLDVGKLEAQFLDRGADYRDGFLIVAVDQDVTLRGRDQEGAELLRSYKVHVADDLMRRERLVPVDVGERALALLRLLFLILRWPEYRAQRDKEENFGCPHRLAYSIRNSHWRWRAHRVLRESRPRGFRGPSLRKRLESPPPAL